MLLYLDQDTLLRQYLRYAETGMGFQMMRASAFGQENFLALLLTDGLFLPFSPISSRQFEFFSVSNWLSGEPPESQERMRLTEFRVDEVFAERASAILALQDIQLPQGYVPAAGAIPLLGRMQLAGPGVFYRFISTPTDPKYQNGTLLPGTYLTTLLDQYLANTGFGAVGRYALPIPAPATYLFQYELPPGSVLRVGTIAPMFGQSGGGVEAKLDSLPPGASVRVLGHLVISAC